MYGSGTTCGIAPSTLGTVQNFTVTCELKKTDGSACDATAQCYTYKATSSGIGSPEFVFATDDGGVKKTLDMPDDWKPSGWTAAGSNCWVRSKKAC